MLLHPSFVLQAILYTHDKIACADYEPHIDPIPVEEDEESAVKIVSIIKKHNEPLVCYKLIFTFSFSVAKMFL